MIAIACFAGDVATVAASSQLERVEITGRHYDNAVGSEWNNRYVPLPWLLTA